MKIFIDPRSTIHYGSMYVLGLYELFGKKNVRFSSAYFADLNNIDILLAFVSIDNDGRMKKYIVDSRDQSDLIEDAYRWSDVYAKVNENDSTFPAGDTKGINVPPSFAVRIWNPLLLAYYLTTNFFKDKIYQNRQHPNIHIRPNIWVRNYLQLLKRQKLSSYTKQMKKRAENYVFFLSTYWSEAEQTNEYRKQYFTCCMENPAVTFDGKFFVNRNNKNPISIPPQYTINKYFSNKEYLARTRDSVFVFNTPAVINCHGWKLGEYLCMGKPIISTPLSNKLPAPLAHGETIYIVNNEEELKAAIDLLLSDVSLREKLERNARAYYEKYAAPAVVVDAIISHSSE